MFGEVVIAPGWLVDVMIERCYSTKSVGMPIGLVFGQAREFMEVLWKF
jgi:hypothetical protein